nr:hypothetical protein CFP56_12020 [Quercus suber]
MMEFAIGRHSWGIQLCLSLAHHELLACRLLVCYGISLAQHTTIARHAIIGARNHSTVQGYSNIEPSPLASGGGASSFATTISPKNQNDQCVDM